MSKNSARNVMSLREINGYVWYGRVTLFIGAFIMLWVFFHLSTLAGLLLGCAIFGVFYAGYAASKKLVALQLARYLRTTPEITE